MAIDTRQRSMLFPKMGKYFMLIFAGATIIAGFRGFTLFGYVFNSIIEQDVVLKIDQNATLASIKDSLMSKGALEEEKAFDWLAKKKEYATKIKPGSYSLKKGTKGNDLFNSLIIGNQTPVKLAFHYVRTDEDLAGRLGKQLMQDSLAFLKAIKDTSRMNAYGFTKETYPTMVLPNTYEVYWTMTPDEFMERMKKEYDRFWTDKRVAQAKKMGLTSAQVVTIASVVQEETNKVDEMPRVAGVYLNRYNRRWPMQADPTVKYAVGDWTLKRVLTEHTKVNSPYNTYKHAGLPPGPINFTELSAVNAVLNAENHKYMYFCAKDDFSGYHVFAKTLSAHNRNAARYHRALNKHRIGYKK